MPTRRLTLTDTDSNTYVESLAVDEFHEAGCQVTKERLRGGLRDGVDVIHVDNGAFRFDILPTRGMSIWKAWMGDLEIGWKSPTRGPVNPQHVPLMEPGGLGWLDGFDEWLVRCGLESNGAPDFDDEGRLAYPLHGRIGNKPAHFVEVAADSESGDVTITGIVEETRFHFFKLRMTSTITTRAGEPGFRIHDAIENFSASETGMQILYHVNYGEPLLDAGAKFVAPIETVVPRNERAADGIANWENYAAEEAAYEEQVYFLALKGDEEGNTQTLLKNAHGTAGASMFFNKKKLPCYSVWKNTTASPDGYVTGLEPATNFPNPRTYEGENRRVLNVAPGATKEFDLRIEIHTDPAAIEGAEKAIADIQGDTPPRVYDAPQPGWCA